MSAIIVAMATDRNADSVAVARAAAAPLAGESGGRWEAFVESPDLCAGFVWRGAYPQRSARCLVEDDQLVLIDGYVGQSDEVIVERQSASAEDVDSHAAHVARRYREGGQGALETLPGSFVIVVIDRAQRRLIAATDRSGSRPMFWAQSDGMLLLAPEPKAFRVVPGVCGEPTGGSVLSMALNGFLFGEYSYWNAVRLLGPARRLVVDKDRTELSRYWCPVFRPGETPPAEDLLHAVTTCMRSHLRSFEKPLLALSGGVDSRVMLACARRAGLPLSAVTWTYDERESDEADFAVAGRVAAAAGIPHVRHRLDNSHLPEQAAQIVASSDGLCGLLGAFTDRETLARRLSADHDVILFGDQCYRGERHIGSRNEALERTGVRVGPRVSLVKFLMRPDAARACLADYRAQIEGLLADIGPVASAHDLHDRLYWQVRVPRLLTGPKSLWRFYMNPVSPLLDIPMLELAQRLPAEQRAEKAFLRTALSEIAPDLCAVPFSTEHSRTKWRKIFRQNGPVQKFIVETLLDPQREFDSWFDRASVAALLRGCMADAEGRRVADDPGDRGFGRLRRSTTSLLLRPAFHPRVVINLLTLKLWFAQFATRR